MLGQVAIGSKVFCEMKAFSCWQFEIRPEDLAALNYRLSNSSHLCLIVVQFTLTGTQETTFGDHPHKIGMCA